MTNYTEEQEETGPTGFGKIRIVKNVFILCLVFFVTFTAYDCLHMLQSTLNHKNGIGVICQAILFGCNSISSLLLPKYVIKRLGCKLTLVLSTCFYLPYIASNLYPHWSFMVPAAALNGLSSALLWGAQCQYLNVIAVQYARCTADDESRKKHPEPKSQNHPVKRTRDEVNPHSQIKFVTDDNSIFDNRTVSYEENRTPLDYPLSPDCSLEKENSGFTTSSHPKDSCFLRKSDEAIQNIEDRIASQNVVASVIARFFGIFGLAYLSTHMCSNIMSYFILQNNAIHSNSTLNSSCVCGADFCSAESDCLVRNLLEPDSENRYILIGICIALAVVSIILMAVFLDSLGDKDPNTAFSLEFLLATAKRMMKTKQILLTPITFYVGMMHGFYVGDFTLSFVGCAWGITHVALVSACYGAAASCSSPMSGCLVKLTGRIPIVGFATVVNVAAQILMLCWEPSAEHPAMFFVLSALWGTTLGVLFSQVSHLCSRNGHVSFLQMYSHFVKSDRKAREHEYKVSDKNISLF